MEFGKEFMTGFGLGIPTGILLDESVRAVGRSFAKKKKREMLEDKDAATDLCRYVVRKLSEDMAGEFGYFMTGLSRFVPLVQAFLVHNTKEGIVAALEDESFRKKIIDMFAEASCKGFTETLRQEALGIHVESSSVAQESTLQG